MYNSFILIILMVLYKILFIYNPLIFVIYFYLNFKLNELIQNQLILILIFY